MKKSAIKEKLDELGLDFLNIDFDTPPEEITYEMLEAEMNKNSLDFVAEQNVLWRAWSRTMINPHPFGFYSEKILMDKEKRKQFLKDINLTLKNIKNVDTKLVDTKLVDTKYSNDAQIQIQPAAVAAGGSLSKKRKKNKSKKQIKKQKKKEKK